MFFFFFFCVWCVQHSDVDSHESWWLFEASSIAGIRPKQRLSEVIKTNIYIEMYKKICCSSSKVLRTAYKHFSIYLVWRCKLYPFFPSFFFFFFHSQDLGASTVHLRGSSRHGLSAPLMAAGGETLSFCWSCLGHYDWQMCIMYVDFEWYAYDMDMIGYATDMYMFNEKFGGWAPKRVNSGHEIAWKNMEINVKSWNNLRSCLHRGLVGNNDLQLAFQTINTPELDQLKRLRNITRSWRD